MSVLTSHPPQTCLKNHYDPDSGFNLVKNMNEQLVIIFYAVQTKSGEKQYAARGRMDFLVPGKMRPDVYPVQTYQLKTPIRSMPTTHWKD